MEINIVRFGSYSVSRVGDVCDVWNDSRTLTPFRMSNGYLAVGLRKDYGNSHQLLHRVFAKAFIPNPDNLPTVDHIDGDKLNNRLSNLRWASRSTQERNKKSTKGYCWHKGSKSWQAQIMIDGRTKHLGNFKTATEARSAYVGAHNMLFSDACVLV